MSSKPDVLWCRQVPDEFIHYGGDRLRLFRIFPLPPGGKKNVVGAQVLYLADNKYASLVAMNGSVPQVKCVSWSPVKERPHFIAAGQNSGRVTVTGFGTDEKGQPPSFGLELVPRTPRPCLAVDWNTNHQHLIAVGLERARADYSLLVWDINQVGKKSVLDSQGSFLRSVAEGAASTLTRPCFEQSQGEATGSLSWVPHQPSTLVAGIGQKSLKIYDLREESFRPNSATSTRAVHGVCMDTLEPNRMASHSDQNTVSIWDLRNFDRPVMSITKPAWTGISKIAWSPTRRGNLAILAKDSPVVRLFDVQHAPFEADFFQGADVTDAIVEQVVTKRGDGYFSSFNWHPKCVNRMLAVSGTGDIHDIDVPEKISLSWQAGTALTWSCGSALARTQVCSTSAESSRNSLVDQDISAVMRWRADTGYGLAASNNAQIAEGNPELAAMWTWLVRCQRLIANGVLASSRLSPNNIGILNVLLDGTGETVTPSFSKGGLADFTAKQYSSPVRRQIQRLCGWDFEESNVEDFLKRLELEKQYERASAIALFHLQMKRAVECLTTGAQGKDAQTSNLHLIAMAMAGFTVSTSWSMWHDVTGSLKCKFSNPYILAAFAFLSGVAAAAKPTGFPHASGGLVTPSVNTSPFAAVLFETNISLADKVAFACSFLSDSQLLEFLNKLTAQMEQDGRLDGLLLSGVDESGMRLLQNYLDHTGDLQTVCLVVGVCGGFDDALPQDSQASLWLETYRDLLDTWRLWHCRAKLDVDLNQNGAATSQAQQIVASCTYCNRSVASESGRGTVGLPNRQTAPARRAQPRVTSCPNCRKPLPRCSLCLMNMGTVSQFRSTSDGSCLRPSADKKSRFKDWMTWCQSCHHGGHSEHMQQWFREHAECPVTNCPCGCAQLDKNLLVGTPGNTVSSGSSAPR